MSKTKTVEWDELRTKNTAESAWLCIEGKVYDVTDFLDEHPGGEEVMLEVAGKDATEEYVDVGHSDDARRMLEGSEAKIKLVGKVDGEAPEDMKSEKSDDGGAMQFLVPVILIAIVAVVYNYSGI